MYANAPPEVAAMKVMLEATATYIALTGASIHYPAVDAGESVGKAASPYFLIEPSRKSPTVAAPSVVFPGGTIQVLMTIADATGQDIEKKAWQLAEEVAALPVGLPITGYDVGMCSEPTGGDRAAQEYADQNTLAQVNALRTIPIIFTFGLS
jgi:hypothetical protein